MRSLKLLQFCLLFPTVFCLYEYGSYQATPVCTPSGPVQSPKNLAELIDLVKVTTESHGTLKPIGSLHSSTDIICTDGTPFSMGHFNYSNYNELDFTATFGAGVKLSKALTFLQNINRTLVIIPQFRDITIGGAIATGAHGSSLKHPTSLSDQIVRMIILDGNGVLRTISDPQELDIFRVNLGLLGIVLEVTFATVPAFKLKMEVVPRNESVLTDGSLIELARNSDYCSVQWFPHSKLVLVTTGTEVPVSTNGSAHQNLYPPSPIPLTKMTVEFTEFLSGMRNMEAFYALEEYSSLMYYQTLVGMLPYFSQDDLNFLNPAIGLHWELTSSNCVDEPNGCSWSNGNNSLAHDEEPVSCGVEELPGIVATIKGILAQAPAPFVLSGIVFRFQKSSKAELYMASGRDSVAVELIYPVRTDVNNPPISTGSYSAIIQALVFKHGGRTHWGKNGMGWFTHSTLLSQYSQEKINRFISTMEQYDPNGILRNKFSARLKGTDNQMDSDPLEKHCAMRQNCICETNSDCSNDAVNAQKCETFQDIDGIHFYNICKDTKTYINPPIGPFQKNNLSDIVRAVAESYQIVATTTETTSASSTYSVAIGFIILAIFSNVI